MPTIIFETAEGARPVTSDEDLSVMELAKSHGIAGIDADCGGQMVCGTCHVHLRAEDMASLPPPDDMEEMILDNVPEPAPDTRLSCQLRVRDMPEGATLTVPLSQR